jgi:hypothetical protein
MAEVWTVRAIQSGSVASFLLLESGDSLLLESGGGLLLEGSSGGSAGTNENWATRTIASETWIARDIQ